MKLSTLTTTCALVCASTFATGTATAQSTQNRSQLTFGAGWSSLHGVIGQVGVDVADLFGTGLDASGSFRKGTKGYDTSFSLGYATELGALGAMGNPQAFVTIDHTASNWSDDAYSGQMGEATAGLSGSLGAIDVSAGGFARVNKISAFHAAASPLITAERGFSWTAGGMLDLGWDTFSGYGLSQYGSGVAASFRFAPVGTRNFASAEVSAKFVQPVFEQFSVALSGEAGVIRGLNGQSVSIYDRVFLGGTAPRGFGVAGIGPRDTAGAIDSALGGTNYVLGSAELRREMWERTALGAFIDVGSVWRLDGAPVGASGVIDDSFFLNTSVGVAMYWETQIGTINFSIAKPVRLRARDTQNLISLNLSQSF